MSASAPVAGSVASSDNAPDGCPSVFVREKDSWSQVSRLGETTYRLRFGGLFQTAWLAALCSHLAELHISIDCTHAKLSKDDSWVAEMHVVTVAGAPDPMTIRYLDLAASSERLAPSALRLATYECADDQAYGGCIKLTLEAADSLGLLGGLLRLLADVALFPLEMHIETRHGRAYDCFWLAAAGGSAPSAEMRRALEARLQNATSDAVEHRPC